MAILIWKHGTTRNEARQMMESRLKDAGYQDSVKWSGDAFQASVGWGVVLDLQGEIQDDAIVLNKSRGAIGDTVLQKAEIAFAEMFPGGRQPI